MAQQGSKYMANKPQNNKDSKPKNACNMVTHYVKHFCPTGYDKSIFYAVTKLLSEKIEQVKWMGSSDAKTINGIECNYFCNFFKIPEQLYNAVFTQVVGVSTPKISGNDSD